VPERVLVKDVGVLVEQIYDTVSRLLYHNNNNKHAYAGILVIVLHI
jgi:hypothetical protein